MALKEYKKGQAFSGVIGRTFDVSKPAWPAPQRAKESAPNVLFIVLDDERYYGFLGRRHTPVLSRTCRYNSQTEPEKTPEEGYHLTPDLVEKAKAMAAAIPSSVTGHT